MIAKPKKKKVTKRSVKSKRCNPIDLKDIQNWKVIPYFTLMKKYLIIEDKVTDALRNDDYITWGQSTTIIRLSDLLDVMKLCKFKTSIEKEEYEEFKKDTVNAKDLFVSL